MLNDSIRIVFYMNYEVVEALTLAPLRMTQLKRNVIQLLTSNHTVLKSAEVNWLLQSQ